MTKISFEYNVPVFTGVPEEFAAAIEECIQAGVTKFQGWFIDFPDHSGMELFADEIISQFA